jgi:hypothetical protein
MARQSNRLSPAFTAADAPAVTASSRPRRIPPHPAVIATYREIVGQWVNQRRERQRIIDVDPASLATLPGRKVIGP